MKLRTSKAFYFGIAAIVCFCAIVFAGKSVADSKHVTKENEICEAETEYFAGSGNFLRETSFVETVISSKVSDVSVSIGSASMDYASIDSADIPVVTAAEVTNETVEVSAPDLGEWNNKVMAKVSESANIRKTADAEGELAGHLPEGAEADIVERGDEWTKISSGTVVGYVKNEFLAFGEEAKQLADMRGKKATIATETLRIRSAADENSEVVALASVGDEYAVTGEENEWITVDIDGTTGYMASAYVIVSYNVNKATSIEEEQAIAEQKAAEQKAKEEKAEAEKKAKKAEESKRVEVETTQRESIAASVDDVTLLGALVQVEAGGQSYECQLAVASTIVNRLNSSRFPNTISEVIYQSGQFPPAHNGKVARVLANGVRSSCLEIAQEAINGKNNIGSYLHFNTSSAVSKGRLSDYTIIDGECFY